MNVSLFVPALVCSSDIGIYYSPFSFDSFLLLLFNLKINFITEKKRIKKADNNSIYNNRLEDRSSSGLFRLVF